MVTRFMICCDLCSEWYHGECVGISLAEGKRMEKLGVEYICVKCQGKFSILVKLKKNYVTCTCEFSSSNSVAFLSIAKKYFSLFSRMPIHLSVKISCTFTMDHKNLQAKE